MVLLSIFGTAFSLVRWGNPNLVCWMSHLYGWVMRGITGISVDLSGQEHLEAHQPCIYVANHQSGFDMMTFGSVFPHRTVSVGKKEILYIPLFGILFKVTGNIMLDRGNRKRSMASLARASASLKARNICVWIFPEGTRNRSGEGLLPFKKGAFYMAIEAGVPIVPIVAASYLELVNWRKGRVGPGRIAIQILPPISTLGLNTTDAEMLAQRTREKMLEALLKSTSP